MSKTPTFPVEQLQLPDPDGRCWRCWGTGRVRDGGVAADGAGYYCDTWAATACPVCQPTSARARWVSVASIGKRP